ncbi:MAG: hypothetical protein OEZ32_03230 [Nitrospinota bacterium]|nr:hypothetical protein [Nitrospinota bacterium]
MTENIFRWTWKRKLTFCLVATVGILSIMATSRLVVRIDLFEAQPKAVCNEGVVNLTWITQGAAVSIEQTPYPSRIIDNLGSLPPWGSASAYVSEDTKFLLLARPGNPKGDLSDNYAEASVTVIPAVGRTYRLEAPGQCVGGSPEWRVANPPEDWDSLALVSAVHSLVEETLIVSHGSSSTTIGPFGSVTYPFAGQEVAGDWILAPTSIPDSVSLHCECVANGVASPADRPECGSNPGVPGILAINVDVVCG